VNRVSPWTFVGTVAALSMLSVSAASFGQSCGNPSAGDCCAANGTPFCSDADCCNLVCSVDTFCCSVEWDAICAGEASGLCTICGGGGCIVDCSGATSEEGEACGDDLNGGCNDLVKGLVGFADVGDVICGDLWADGSTRDTDWYEFSLAENKVLTFTATTEVQSNLFLVSANCPPAIIAEGIGTPGQCTVSIDDKCVLAGTYRIVIVPAFFNGFPCVDGVGKKYLLSIVDTGDTCTAPNNDSCEGAIGVGDPSDTSFDTTLAFTNGDDLPTECTSFGSVTIFNDLWYHFTAASTGLYEITTCNQADYDTRLAIYEGPCAALAIVACNDDGDGCSGFTSKILTSLTSGTEYWVRVGGFGEGGGTGVLGIHPFQGCDVTCPSGATLETEACGDDENGGCNSPPTSSSTCCVANGGVGCDDVDCQNAVCSADPFCCSVAWDGICAGEAGSLCGDLCAATPEYQVITAGATVCGTFWAANNTRDTDWYQFHLDTDATVTLTVQSTLNVTIGLLSADCPPTIYTIDATQSCGASVSACLPPGDSVVFIALANFTSPPCGSDPLNQYTFSLATGGTCAPLNDECLGATPILNGDTEFSTEAATTSALPLDASCDKGFGLAFVKDLWFTYVATCTGPATFSTCGTVDYDSRLALYSGSCANLAIVDCNDDGAGCPGLSSKMTASVTEGTTYYLRVGGFSGGGGGTLNINCGGGGGGPSNDDCANALPLPLGATAFSTVGATGSTQMNPGSCTSFGSSLINNDVWFDYLPTASGTCTISTCNAANFDTRIGVFSDCNLTQTVACNDDFSGCGLTSTLSFAAVCGTHYKVSIGAFGAAGIGTGTVTVAQAGTACPAACPADLNQDGTVGPADLGILLGGWGGAGATDLSGNGNTGPEDLGILLGAWGPCT